MITVGEMAEQLKRYPEQDVLEVLDISSEDIVDRFMDRVAERYDYLIEDFTEVDEDEDFYE